MSTKQNLVIEQGTTIHFEIQLYDANNNPLVDASGYSASSQIRESWESNTSYAFDTSFVGGTLNLDMTANASALIPNGPYQYDVKLSVGNTTIRLMEGNAQVTPQITKG